MIRILMSVAVVCGLVVVSSANEPSLEPVQQSLRDSSRSVWFEPEDLEVKPVELKPQSTDTLHRHSRWLPKKTTSTTPTNTPMSSGSPSGSPSGLGTGFGWGLLILMGVIAAGLLIFAFLKIGESVTLDSSSSKSSGMVDDLVQQTAMRIKELPAELRRDNMDLKSEALRLMNAGDLDEAVKCLFGYQLLLLDGMVLFVCREAKPIIVM